MQTVTETSNGNALMHLQTLGMRRQHLMAELAGADVDRSSDHPLTNELMAVYCQIVLEAVELLAEGTHTIGMIAEISGLPEEQLLDLDSLGVSMLRDEADGHAPAPTLS